MSAELERRYRRLLRLYPRQYRAQREAELLETLLENAPHGRQRPVPREVLALVLGSLRVRAGALTRNSPGQIWLSALRLSTLVLLAHAAAQFAAYSGRVVSEVLTGRGLALLAELGYPTTFALCTTALWAVAAGRYRLGILTAAAAFVTGQWSMSWTPAFDLRLVLGDFWQLPLAIAFAVPLVWGRPARSAWPAAWLLAIPVALFVLPTQFDASLRVQPFALLAVEVGCLLWTVVDLRAPIAGGALLLGPMLSLLSFYLPGLGSGRGVDLVMLTAYAVTALVLAGVGVLAVGRRIRM